MIRVTKLSDVSQIEFLMKSVEGFWDKGWRQDVIQLGIRSANGLSFVYEENDNILGFICAHDFGFRAYLSELVVSPKVQGKGVGQQLVEKVQEELKERGCKIIISDVWKDAEHFYVKLGWSKPNVILIRKKL
jgi:ribosomal protein S18 acetylase RimI-like enzyme